MNAASTDRNHVIEVLEGLEARFNEEKATPPTTGVNPVEAARVAAQLRDALDWVAHLLVEEGPKNILLTHHQVFSAVDGRPGRHHTDIHLGPLAEPGNVFAWFWGHEHRCLIYD
jgi:hypothetical protein